MRKPFLRRRLSRALCSIGVGPHEELLEISARSYKAFASRHGYDVVLTNEVLAPERPPAWSKIRMVRDLLERYDEVLWIDADAAFVDTSKDIADLVRRGKDIYLVEHRWHENDDWRSANTGVFLTRATDWSRAFLDAVWAHERFIEHPWWENAAALDLLGYEIPEDLTPPRKRRDTRWNERVELIGLEWNSTAGASLAPHPRIRHTGRGPIEKVREELLGYVSRTG